MYAKKNNGKKLAILLLAVALLIGCTIGGTLAWLTAESKTVTNTFVAGEIGELGLDETDGTSQNEEGKYIIIPGKAITKDPKISYTKPEENDVGNVYIFVEVTAEGWTYDTVNKKFTSDVGGLSWSVAEGWTHLKDTVFYIETAENVVEKPIIAGNTITVPNTITEDTIDAVAAAADLTFSVYAIQAEGMANAAAAWTALNP